MNIQFSYRYGSLVDTYIYIYGKIKVHKFLSAIFVYLYLSLSVHADDFSNFIAAYEKGDYKTAFNLIKPLAEQGNAIAQSNLDVMYENGKGVPEDDKQAVKWFRLAAEQGLADAQSNLGVMYANGQGIPEDDKQAVKWYRLAAEQGNAYLSSFNTLIISNKSYPMP